MQKIEISTVNMFREAPWPGNILSNFSNTPFVIDGINCTCAESFIQSLKISSIGQQKEFCSFEGQQAWETGSKFTEQVIRTGTGWWLGKTYKLHSPEHFALVKRGLVAKFSQSDVARQALLASGSAILTHDYGHPPGKKQSLPVDVFCRIVTDIRSEIVREQNA